MPTEKEIRDENGEVIEIIQLEGSMVEVERIRDNYIDHAIQDNTLEGLKVKEDFSYLNVFEKGMWVIKVTKETLSDVKVPEPLWHKDKYPNDYPFSADELVSGVGDGLIDEVKSIPDLLIFGLSLFDKKERSMLAEFVSNLSIGTVKKIFVAKADKYTGHGEEVAFHEAGYDAVQIASMFWGGIFTKGKKAAETADAVDGFVGKIDNVLDDVVAQVPEDLKKLSGKTQTRIFKELADDPKLLKAVNDNPDIAKAWTQHKPPYPTTEQLERATEALDELDDVTRQKVVGLIEESEQKLAFLTRMGKARDFDQLVVGQKVATDFVGNPRATQVTLKVTKADGTVTEIVADHFVKDGSDFKIIDSKFTEKGSDFNLNESFTKNQRETVNGMKNNEIQSIEVRADNSKLTNFEGLQQGDLLPLDNVKIDVYKSAADGLSVEDVIHVIE